MSYHVYITRAEFWAENEGAKITVDEWLERIISDPDLTRDERNGPGFAVLSESRDRTQAWLDWYDGNVYANYPNRTLQRKMLQIADRLNANVQGDDGERYETIDDFPASVRRPDRATEAREKLPPYKRREIIQNLITYGIIAALIIAANVFDFW